MKNRKYILCLFAAILFLVSSLPVFAAEEMPDLSRRGSISLTIRDTVSQEPVSGGELTLVQVASVVVDNGYVFKYTEAFSECEFPLDDLESETLADELAEVVAKQKIEGKKMTISSEGNVTFSELELGLYLVMQNTVSENGLQINPFLITIPMKEDEQLIYDIDASPKPSTVTQTDTNVPGNGTGSETLLPQTGQLWWPVPLLAIIGLFLFFLGWIRRKHAEHEG